MSVRSAILAATCLVAACGGGARAVLPPPQAPPPPPLVAASPAPREVVAPAPALGDLESVLRQSPSVAAIVDRAPAFRLQVVVSVPTPDGLRWRRREGFRVDAEYFYPASAIKLCSAVAALETVTELREAAAGRHDASAAQLDPRALFTTERPSRRRAGGASIAALVRGALVVSDNEANNDLFDLAGFDALHERMWRMGLSSVRMRHHLGAPSGDDARSSPRIELTAGGDPAASAPVVIPPREGRLKLGKNDEAGVKVGESYNAGGRVVEEPMSFEEKNRISLLDLQELLVAVMRPELRPAEQSPRLGAPERALLIEALTALPSSRGGRPDMEHKPLIVGLERVVPRGSLTVASKGGRAYGFAVENAYVLDARTGSSFFLTAALYANANGRLNDDAYEYRELALPLLADLGEVVARAVLEDAQ